MYKLGINFDEISDDLSTAIEVMNECGVQYGELRTVNKKNGTRPVYPSLLH